MPLESEKTEPREPVTLTPARGNKLLASVTDPVTHASTIGGLVAVAVDDAVAVAEEVAVAVKECEAMLLPQGHTRPPGMPLPPVVPPKRPAHVLVVLLPTTSAQARLPLSPRKFWMR